MKLQKVIRFIFILAFAICFAGLVYSIGAIEHGGAIVNNMVISGACLFGLGFFGQVLF